MQMKLTNHGKLNPWCPEATKDFDLALASRRAALSGNTLLVATSSTLCLKKVPTFKLYVTLSNLNRFLKFLRCWKSYEICKEICYKI